MSLTASPSIFLCGFMGVGKSTVGEILSQKLQCLFVDTDQQVVLRAGKSIARIFKDEGESSFRKQESQVLDSLKGRGRAVVALGGGALSDPENLDYVKRFMLVYLSASPETLMSRLERHSVVRPLLEGFIGNELKDRITMLLRSREILYRQAHVEIPTDKASAEEVASKVEQAYLQRFP